MFMQVMALERATVNVFRKLLNFGELFGFAMMLQ